MKKLILLMVAAATLFVGCAKENKNDVPFAEQIIGKWVVTEYFDKQSNSYKPVAGTPYAGYYATINANNTYSTSGGSQGTYVINGKTIECKHGTDSKLYLDMIEISGNSAIADYYYSADTKTRFKAKKQ